MSRFRVVLSTLLLLGLLTSGAPGFAQDDAGCAGATAAVAEALAPLFAEMEAGQAYRVAVAFDALDEVETQPVALDPDETALLASGALADGWDVIAAQPADGLFLILFGATETANPAAAETAEHPTAAVTGAARPNLNLRAGPGTDYPVLDVLPFGAEAVADGRNEAGDWLRLRAGEAAVWGFAEYLEAETEGAFEALDVLAADDLSRADLYPAPMQAFNLTTAPDASVCGGAGLLVQNIDAETIAHVEVNGVRLALDEGTLLIKAQKPDAESEAVLDITVLAGSARVTLPGSPSVAAFTGAHIVVEPGLAPEQMDDIVVEEVASTVPVDLLPVALDEQPVVEPPPPPVAAPAGAAGGSFVPAQPSVWQSFPGSDNMGGACAGPAIVFCDHPVAITPNGDGTITWRGQEPTGYVLAPTGPNSFYFSGRRHQGDGNITLALSFTSTTTWSMTMTIVMDSEPGCTHTFYYTASFQWFK
ncbi:MAG: SH3 domain-containing protein [Anaerolineae bacterium]|nr:SH3 domain-containing protein [Anaerolineae bacterium]